MPLCLLADDITHPLSSLDACLCIRATIYEAYFVFYIGLNFASIAIYLLPINIYWTIVMATAGINDSYADNLTQLGVALTLLHCSETANRMSTRGENKKPQGATHA